MTNVKRWFWGSVSCVYPSCWLRENFTERDFLSFGVFWAQVVEISSNESSIQSCGNIIWVAF
jgi:hypothetical protein